MRPSSRATITLRTVLAIRKKVCNTSRNASLPVLLLVSLAYVSFALILAYVGKATRRTANSIFQNRLFTPSFSPGFNGGNSFKCESYSSCGVGLICTWDSRPRLGTRSVREPSGWGMYCCQPTCRRSTRTKSTIFFSSMGVFLWSVE